MKISHRWFFNLILVSSFIVFFFFQNAVQGEQTIRVKADDDYAADFTLKDITGRDVKLSDYKGRTVLLNFMATWCPDCRASIPHLKEIHSIYNANGLIIFNIDLLESRERATAFSKKYEIPYPVLLDGDGKVARSYGVLGVPVKVLINREGRIICWNCRSLDNLLEKQFEMKVR